MTYLKPFFKFPQFQIFCLFLSVFILLSSGLVWAEGSKELNANGGNRAYLDDDTDGLSGISRRATIYVYAKNGETIHLGSSTMGASPLSPPTPTNSASSNYELVVNVAHGGNVKAGTTATAYDDSFKNCKSSCNKVYVGSTTVKLTASADSNYTFTGWAGDCSSSGTTNPIDVTVNTAGMTCTANFSPMAWNGKITATAPNGTTTTFNNSDCGEIANYTQEDKGPVSLTTGGYNDCRIVITADGSFTTPTGGTISGTAADGEGIWTIHYFSADNGKGGNGITSMAYDAQWDKADIDYADITDQPNYLIAWDATVSNGTVATLKEGRVYANYLPINMGGNGRNLHAKTYVRTQDGALYLIDTNGIDPWVSTFFANNKGFTKDGDPIYRSVQFIGAGTDGSITGTGYDFHSPEKADDANNVTHKLFFYEPANDLPTDDDVPLSGGYTWLNPDYIPPTVPELSFTGIEGTTGQIGTEFGGDFTFNNENDAPISYSIKIDINNDGIYGNSNDRVLVGTADVGNNTVFWNGLDGDGNKVSAGTILYKAVLEFNIGEVHFPFIDAENNENGFTIERKYPTSTDDPDLIADSSLIHYDDRHNNGDYSLCAAGEGATDCYGTALSPRQALGGTISSGGAHGWDVDFGDRRGVDTWTYIPYHHVDNQIITILVLEADIAITKSTPTVNGTNISYTITVTNNGTSNLNANNLATVADQIPNQINNVSWTCTIAGTGACTDSTGTGNNLNTTVWLNKGSTATFAISGQLTTTTESFTNTATVTRPDDVNDPNETNNTASSSYTPPTIPPDNPPPPPPVDDDTEVKLTVNILEGGEGNITSTPVGIDCDSSTPAEPDENICEQTFNPDNATEVTLTPNPASGYEFSHWTGNSDCLDGIVTMDRDLQCYAVFKPISDTSPPPADDDDTTDDTVDLTVTVIGHGTVTSEPSQFDCTIDQTCVETYDVDAQSPLFQPLNPVGYFKVGKKTALPQLL
ncbi:MAG: hypothetical protein BWK79_18915 [Beggiatoa sp. IS2]|nr:MAG: hypothetical protein BWK79_18915 [Beggiatoa sp. IS2]